MKRKTVRVLSIALALVMMLTLMVGCQQIEETTTDTPETSGTPGTPELSGTLTIFHAGSLTVPVAELSKAFREEHPDVKFETEAAGSRTTARKVSELGREADLVMSADYTVIDNLLIPDFADWNVRFARNTMVIAYTDQSKSADEINSDNWYDVLPREGVVYGHSEPDADPCGYRTLMVWQLAEKYYDEPGLYEKLDEHCPPKNIRPKSVELIALLESGDMDYAFEYRSVAVQHELNFVELPEEINLSMVKHADFYSEAKVELSGSEPGETITTQGKPIVYGVTIPNNAPSPKLATEFVRFLLGPEGQAIMEEQGQPPIVPAVSANMDKLPGEIKDMVEAAGGASETDAETALTFTGKVDNKLSLSMADLQGMDVVEKTIEHPKKGEQTYTGIMMSTLLEEAQPNEGATLTFTASDAYSVDVPLSDARACTDCMVTFDDGTLRLVMPDLGSSYWVKDVVSIEAK
ncbi:MAG: tungstate ABC transporter substrate-binding protein WtpA [Dehalococcoidia bacterium]